MKFKLRFLSLLLAVLTLCAALSACSKAEEPAESEASESESSESSPEESTGSEEESVGGEEDIFLAQAEALSKYIIGIVSKSDLEASALSEGSFDERQLNLFVLLHTGCAQNDPSDIYCSSFYKTSDGLYHFPKYALQKMMFEVFGIKDFVPPFAEDDQFRENDVEYLSTLEFGFGPILSFKNIGATYSGEDIEVRFTLTDNLGFEGEPGWEEHGEYKIIFDIISEDDSRFLRFKSFSKA